MYVSEKREEIIHSAPQAPDMFNPKVSAQTCGIIQKVYETKQNTTMGLIKSVVGGFSEIQPKMSK